MTIDVAETIVRAKAALEARVGIFFNNANMLYAVKDRLGVIAKSPDPALKEPIRIATENHALLTRSQAELQNRAQNQLKVFGMILDDISKVGKLTVMQRLLTTNIYGSRITGIVTDASNLGVQINAQNNGVRKLDKETLALESAAKGQGLIPSMSKILSPLSAGIGKLLTVNLGIGLAVAAVFLYFYLPKRK